MDKIDFVDVGVAIKKHFGDKLSSISCENNEIRCYIEGQCYSIAFWNNGRWNGGKPGICVDLVRGRFLCGDHSSIKIKDVLTKELGLDG
jgi:hypothetical protein